MNGYAFHAAPPRGEWFNDPVGLVRSGGAYRLFVQHAANAPDFDRVGWARLTSSDLFRWRFDGPVIAADGECSRYSGSIIEDRGTLSAFLTLNDEGKTPRQSQIGMISHDAGASWSLLEGLGPAGRNVRDPFVWDDGRRRRMLVAHPCDWADWPHDSWSRLTLWEKGKRGWRQTGSIGPWHPRGVMWEMPGIIDFGERQALLISTIDRREDVARCGVRYWIGRLSDNDFAIEGGFPEAGVLLDIGPDFYAAVVADPNIYAGSGRVITGWASTWSRPKSECLPGGGFGGPTAMQRLVELRGDRLSIGPLPEAMVFAEKAWLRKGSRPGVEVARAGRVWNVEWQGSSLRLADEDRAWSINLPNQHEPASLFIDQDLIELFVGGLSFTIRGSAILA